MPEPFDLSGMPTFVIVGGGFTGSMVAVHLLRHNEIRARVILIEKRARCGRGLAYSTDNWGHLLNVPAGKMSAFPSGPEHFLSWVNSAETAADYRYDASSFVPRRLYGDYLASLLQSSLEANPDRFKHIRGQVIEIATIANGLELKTADGTAIRADRVVLALGNFPPFPPINNAPELAATGHYIPDPWEPGALSRIPPGARVILIGAGLTMVDIAIALIGGGHHGELHAISRHGLRPLRHPAVTVPVSPFRLDDSPLSVRGMLRAVRHRIKADSEQNWQGVIDALRPITQELWRRTSIAERRRFLRHLQARWDVHRHRLAPEIAAQIDQAAASGQLHFHAGRIIACAKVGDRLLVTIRPRGHNEIVTLATEYVINCTGPASDYRRIDDPLVRSLIERGLARPDPLGLGLEIGRDLHPIGAGGNPSERLFAAGPMTKGEGWEITAVPDLRTQAAALADRLAAISVAESGPAS